MNKMNEFLTNLTEAEKNIRFDNINVEFEKEEPLNKRLISKLKEQKEIQTFIYHLRKSKDDNEYYIFEITKKEEIFLLPETFEFLKKEPVKFLKEALNKELLRNFYKLGDVLKISEFRTGINMYFVYLGKIVGWKQILNEKFLLNTEEYNYRIKEKFIENLSISKRKLLEFNYIIEMFKLDLEEIEEEISSYLPEKEIL
jgi:hypothetical protein